MHTLCLYSTNISCAPTKHWLSYVLLRDLLDLRILICKMGIILSYLSGLPRIKEDHACGSALQC